MSASSKKSATYTPDQEQSFQIGERTYTVGELPIDAFLEVGNIVSDNIEALAEAGLLNEGAWKIEGADYSQVAIKIAKVWRRVPTVIDRIFVTLLQGEQEDDGEYIRKHMSPR